MSTTADFTPNKLPELPLLLGFVLLVSAPLAFWQLSPGITEETALMYTRYTARVSFMFFLPAFLAKSLQVLWPSPWTSQLLRRRRNLGLAFALAHTIHMGGIITLYLEQDRWFTADDGAALVIYLLMGLMVVTSNTFSLRRLGKAWKWLHKIGMYALFIGFFVTYLGRVMEYDASSTDPNQEYFAIYVVLLLMVSAAWLARIAAFWKTRAARQA